MARDAVLDASALLALLNREPGAEAVVEAIPAAAISAVNLAEVTSKLADLGMPEQEIRHALEGLGLLVFPLGEQEAVQVGMLRPQTRDRGLSLGDRACLALAVQTELTALTADRSWEGLDVGASIELIR